MSEWFLNFESTPHRHTVDQLFLTTSHRIANLILRIPPNRRPFKPSPRPPYETTDRTPFLPSTSPRLLDPPSPASPANPPPPTTNPTTITNTANMSLTNCRFYPEKYPEVDSYVMVNVKQVSSGGARPCCHIRGVERRSDSNYW